MDVNWTHTWSNFLIICWHCNKPGHYARECPNTFDVQMMTMQKKLELIPELLALADVLGMPLPEDNSTLEADAICKRRILGVAASELCAPAART